MYKLIDKGICAPMGFSANGIHAGIRKGRDKKDLTLIYSSTMCKASATYTLNKVKGAPIAICKKHLKDGLAQAIIVNSGNANTCNYNGEEIAEAMCELSANALNLKTSDVLVASTGVIGEVLSIDPVKNNIDELVNGLSSDKASDAWEGISTTDTKEKQFAIEMNLNGKSVKLGAMAKGSGMIHPNMATMLAFVTSDVNISSELLDKMTKEVVDDTFNMVSVDGDTSTNDTLIVMCNGQAENDIIDKEDETYEMFKNALKDICTKISKAIAEDGEGATKLLTCNVYNACDTKNAKIVAKSVITSSLVKSAFFGCDANWGRILCAIGYSEASLNVNSVDVTLKSISGEIKVCENGSGLKLDEEKALRILKEDEVIIDIDLKDGEGKATAWGCDLTYEYVKINGEYRT